MPLVLSSLSRQLAFGALRAYPRGWRDRYADEVAAILERRSRLGDVLDLTSGAVDAWRLELGGAWRSARTVKVLVGYVVLQLGAFAALRVLAGPGRLDVAALWAIEYGLGYVALCYVLSRTRARENA